MTDERKDIKDIENFLLGGLPALESKAIHQKMNQSDEFKQKVFTQKLITEKLMQFSHGEMDIELNRIHEKYFGKRRKRRFLWIFFSGIGLIGSTYLILNYTQRKESLSQKVNTKILSINNDRVQKPANSSTIKIKISEPGSIPEMVHEGMKTKEEVIPVPTYIESMYDKGAVKDLNRLSFLTKGNIFFSNSSGISGYINKIIAENLSEGSEIVILIDKTQSMEGDIKNVKDNVKQILAELGKKKDTRICISVFGDANFNTKKEWFYSSGFTTDPKALGQFLNTIKLVQGVDTPESIYDAICYQLDEIPFTTEKKRTLILLTDAAAQKNEFTVNDENYTLNKCRKEKVTIFSIALQPDTK